MNIPMSKTFQINGEAIPEPTSCGFDSEDIYSDDSGMTLDGKMHFSKIATKRVVSFKYDALPQIQMQRLMSVLKMIPFSLTYLDPEVGMTTIQCYTQQRKSDLWPGFFYNGLWRDIAFDCKEM